MAPEYDTIARQYKRSKELPFRTYIEAPLLRRMVGDLAGFSAIDLACGDGHYTRKLRRDGAARVVGVDLSAAMIELAREQETREPLGIEYILSPAEDLTGIGPFDLVTAAFLFNNATTRDHLEAMCRTVAALLRPGGRLAAINSNIGPGEPPEIGKYGYEVADSAPIAEGDAYRLNFLLGPDSFTLVNYCYSRPTYEAVFRAAGFRSVRWQPPEVSAEGIEAFGAEFWADYVRDQPIIGIECLR